MKLSTHRETVCAMLLSGKSPKDIATTIGVHIDTLRGWLRTDTQLRTMLAEQRDSLLQESMDTARNAMSSAISRLVKVVESPMSNDQAAISAARLLLEYTLKTHKFSALEQELLELKTQMVA